MKILNLLLKTISIFLIFSLLNTANAENRREIGNMILEGVPEIPEEIKDRIQQYQNTRSASFADWLPNNDGILLSTRFGNTSQLHTVSMPGGARNQITFFDEPAGRKLNFAPPVIVSCLMPVTAMVANFVLPESSI